MSDTGLLFSPLKLKHTSLKNRIIMGSMHTGLEETKDVFERMAAYFAERARGGVGMIITGGIAPNEESAMDGAMLHNEAEAAQLVLRPTKALKGLTATVAPLAGLHPGPGSYRRRSYRPARG